MVISTVELWCLQGMYQGKYHAHDVWCMPTYNIELTIGKSYMLYMFTLLMQVLIYYT